MLRHDSKKYTYIRSLSSKIMQKGSKQTLYIKMHTYIHINVYILSIAWYFQWVWILCRKNRIYVKDSTSKELIWTHWSWWSLSHLKKRLSCLVYKYNQSTGKEEWDENQCCQGSDKWQEQDEVEGIFYMEGKLFFWYIKLLYQFDESAE